MGTVSERDPDVHFHDCPKISHSLDSIEKSNQTSLLNRGPILALKGGETGSD